MEAATTVRRTSSACFSSSAVATSGSIDPVRELASVFRDSERSCAKVRDLAHDHLQQVRNRIEDLQQLDARLQAFVRSCEDECIGGPARDCTIIENLSAPSETQGRQQGCSGKPTTVQESAAGFREVRQL